MILATSEPLVATHPRRAVLLTIIAPREDFFWLRLRRCPELKTGTGGNRENGGEWVDPWALCPEQNAKSGDFGPVTFFVFRTIAVSKTLAWV
jgi:hypothetical protein